MGKNGHVFCMKTLIVTCNPIQV